jgi:hypothetical protein
MNRLTLSLITAVICFITAVAQQPATLSTAEQEIINLSNAKWQWMSDKNVDKLSELFHDTAQFVHMGGYWGKDAELTTIKNGAIWYKKAEIHNQEVKFAGPTATVYSTIHLNSVVGGNNVRFPFFVTETYLKEEGKWKLITLVFTKTLGE